MYNFLLIAYLAIFDIAICLNMFMLLYMFKKLSKDNKKNSNPKPVRKHATIKTSNYNNSFGNRGYDQFKNKNGLYEPQTPKKGIELKVKKEE